MCEKIIRDSALVMAIDGKGWDRLRHVNKRSKKVSKGILHWEKKSTIVQLELISSSRNDLRTGGLPTSYYL